MFIASDALCNDKVIPVGTENLRVDGIPESEGQDMARRIVSVKRMQWPLSVWFTLGVEHRDRGVGFQATWFKGYDTARIRESPREESFKRVGRTKIRTEHVHRE